MFIIEEIKRRLKNKNITQKELAQSLGVSENRISRFLNGNNSSLVLLDKLLKLTSVKTEGEEYSLDDIRELKNYSTFELLEEIMKREKNGK
ncbi:helix-turn-helix domain-containing protein [Cetobacterium sp.]|uniref:helix-turn-helix domain-containing protein n=1 Tax=Cetobacterium sp. TaxID=2071632 RepID=UPI003F36916A